MNEELAQAVEPAMAENNSTIQRDAPDPAQQRRALVAGICEDVRSSREHWNRKAFQQMRRDQAFAAGRQWPQDMNPDTFADSQNSRYVANIVLRHIQQRTATLYGKNPKIISRRKERLLGQIWDGTVQSLQTAMMALQSGIPDPHAVAIAQDAMQVFENNSRMQKIGKTLELLFEHEISEQTLPFKVQMKATIRRTLTTGVGYLKLGYQRVMAKRPEVERKLADMSERLAAVERMSADVADGVKAPDSAEAEELRLAMQALAQEEEIVVREGLSLSYPDSTSIIPQKTCKQLRGFVGCDWVAEEFYMTREEITETYQIDVGTRAANYRETAKGYVSDNSGETGDKAGMHCVWEVYNRKTGLVYVVCDGYPDFLQEPSKPDVWLERFWPWFAMVFNEVYDDDCVFPPSDVSLIRDMQLELNRARQGLREHRRAARPKTFARKGVLEDGDKENIQNAEANAVIELQGLQPNEDIKNVLQAYSGPNIDPSLYDPSPAYEDVLRVVGQQEANLGGTSGATATESSIAEGSRATAASSTVDDLDEFLTEFARAAGQVLFRETSVQTVREVVGPGAVWPELTKDEIARELYLDVEAASTGRPNQAQEIQNAQHVFPLLMQIPGVSPEWMARELLRRLDDRLDLSDAFAANMPSVQMLNRSAPGAPSPAGAGPDAPDAQGAQGADNAPSTQPAQVNAAPRPPTQPPIPAGMPAGNLM